MADAAASSSAMEVRVGTEIHAASALDSDSLPVVIGAVAAAGLGLAVAAGGGGSSNKAPTVAATAAVTTAEDTAAKVTVAGTDPDNDTLTYTAAGAKSGAVSGGTGGVFTYTPNANFNGTDSFTVTVSDGKLTATQTVNVTVTAANDAPTVAATQTVAGTEDTAAKVTVAGADVDTGDTLTYTAAAAKNGTVTGGTGGVFTYTPNANFSGTDTFAVTVKDAAGATATQTVTVNVAGVNDAPTVAATQTVAATEDTAAKVTVAGSDVDTGDTLTYTAGAAAHGTVTGGTDGVFTYTPAADYNGADSFTVTVKDAAGASATQTVTVNVAAVNDAPTIDAAATRDITVASGASKGFVISASDIDSPTSALKASLSDAPDHGTINETTLTYTSTAGYVGEDSFKISVTDGDKSTEYTVAVHVTGIPSATIAVNAAGSNTDSGAVNTTYNVSSGNYAYTITGFGAGDHIVGPAGNPGTLDNSSFTDGQVVLQWANAGQVTQVVLAGLTAAQDSALFSTADLNTLFGAGTFA